MSRRPSKSKREIIYEPLAPLPQQAKFPRRRKTVHGLGLAPPLPLPGLVKRQSSLTQIGWIAPTPPSNSKRARSGEEEADGDGDGDGEEDGEGDGEYMGTDRRPQAKAKVKARARGVSGSGSGSAKRSSKKVLEKTDSQPTFTQAVRHISRSNSSDLESAASEGEEEDLPLPARAKTGSTSRKAKPKPKPRTTSKKFEKTDSQPTFTQALRTAPVPRTKRPAQQFQIYDDHDPAETPMERAAKRRKHRGEIPEVMDLVALRDSGYAHRVGHSVKGESESESPEIAESSQVLGLDSDEAIVLGKAELVRKLRNRDVVSPARPATTVEEERRVPSLRLRKNGQAVVERSPLKSRDGNARSPVKPVSGGKGKAKVKAVTVAVAGEESQLLALEMLGVMGTQVVSSSAVFKHDSEEEDDDGVGENEHERMASGTAKKRGLARKTTIQDSSEGSDTESEVEDLEEVTPKPPKFKHHGSIAGSQVEREGHADATPDEYEDESADANTIVQRDAIPPPKPRTSPRKLRRVTTVQESQVEDFGIQDDDEWNDWDDEMGAVTLSTTSFPLPEPQTHVVPSLKRKVSVRESRLGSANDEDRTAVAKRAAEDDMPPPLPQARPSKLQRVHTVQESQPEDFDFDVPLDEDDDAANMDFEIAKEDIMPPLQPQSRPRKLERVTTVQDSQIDDFGEDLEMEWVEPLTIDEASVVEEVGLVEVGEDEHAMAEEVAAVQVEHEEALAIEEDETAAVEEEEAAAVVEGNGSAVVERGEAAVVEEHEFVDIDELLADQERTLASDRGFGGEVVEGGIQTGKLNEMGRGEGEVVRRRSQLGADDLDAEGPRADLYEKSPALVDAVNDACALEPRHDARSDEATARNQPAEAPEIEWYSTARERSSQRPASQLADSGNDGVAVEPVQNLVNDIDRPRFVDMEIINLQDEDIDANATLTTSHEAPTTRPLEIVGGDEVAGNALPPPSAGHNGQTSKPIEIIELTSDNEDDEIYEDETTPGLESIANDDNEDYFEGTYDPASAALDRDAARFAQRTQTQGWKQTQFSVYSHDLDEPAPVVRHRPFMTPGKVYKKTFDEPVEQEDEEWEDDEAGMQLEAELSGAVGGVVVSSQAGERNNHGVQMMVRGSQNAEEHSLRGNEEVIELLADDERVPSSPPALTFTKPALPELQPVPSAGDERVPSSPPALRPSQVSTVGPTQLSSIRPGSRNGPSTETQWSLHSPPKFTQARWQPQEETLSSSPLALPPWTSPDRKRYADMGMGKSKGKQAVMGSMGGYSLGELEDFSLPPPPPISSSRAGTQSGRSSSPVVR
ncbi:hypothetical protein LTR56_018483 [Elasticomyces elasticus]|nr:hypothetical protein LTR56_018483 [Elasticomyces elasticus]KAK3632673.1 hypothetical protein LTR22_020487 [Elasticomyces elasticus]KAK4912213.1 hypothetical protein LTR49_019309 [Elasticomyces elasticus]KAK5769342.1 hypothetical protein LTS12_000269 [Elasticomyces elasticus]